MKKVFTSLCLLLVVLSLSGQSNKLANQYFRDGEYEKASVMYKKLMEASRGSNEYYLGRYLECLIYMNEFDTAKKVVSSQMKRTPQASQYHVHMGNLLEKQGLIEEAEKEFQKAIEGVNGDQMVVNKVATTFRQFNKPEYAIKAYERGEQTAVKPELFVYQMADLYRQLGNQSKMIEYYLKSLKTGRLNVKGVQDLLSRYIEKDEFGELMTQVYILIQEDPDELEYLEILEWVFIQQGDYASALRQAKAIDRRSNSQGLRVYNLATVAANAGEYEAAANAFNYVINEVSPRSPYYMDARKEVLNAQRRRCIRDRNATTEELTQLCADYASFVDEVGKNDQTAGIMADWAEIEALYLGDIQKAIDILNEIIGIASINKFILNNAKLDLGDYYLIMGEIWEATLLYSQVDKEFREDYLGEIARYKNARLSYFNGDFEWAQAQYDILKSATSRLISNDAIDQSVFIMDNLGLDTTPIPLQMYASAELLTFQNKFDDAFAKMDSISLLYPSHQLEDDIWYLQARSFVKQKRIDEAITKYMAVFEQYPEDIRADNALFELAEVYENLLNDEAKAMELYEKIFIDYSGSTLAVEARKNFRRLRGDVVQ